MLFWIRALVQKQKLNLIYGLFYFGLNGNGGGICATCIKRDVKAIKAMLQIFKVGRSSYSSNDLGPVMVSYTTNKAGIWLEKQFLNQILIL